MQKDRYDPHVQNVQHKLGLNPSDLINLANLCLTRETKKSCKSDATRTVLFCVYFTIQSIHLRPQMMNPPQF